MKLTNVKFLLLFILAAVFLPSAHAYTNLTGCGTITEANQNYLVTAATMSSSSGPCLTINGSGTNTLDITCQSGTGATVIVSTDSSAPAVKIQSSAYRVTFHQCGFTGPVNAVTVDSSSYIAIGDNTFGPGTYPVSGTISVTGSDHVTLTYLAFGNASAALFADSDYPIVEYSSFNWGTSGAQAVIKMTAASGTGHVTQQGEVLSNTIDGGWDQSTGSGIDDGIYLVGCNYCVVELNDIRKCWDAGIEFAGPITNTTVDTNSISAVGVAAINGYFNFSLDSSSIGHTRFCNGLWGTSGGNHVCNASNLNGHNSKMFDFSNVTNYITAWNTQVVKFSNTAFDHNYAFTPNSTMSPPDLSGWGGSSTVKYTGGTSVNIDMTPHDSGGYSYTTNCSFTNNHLDYNESSGDVVVLTGSFGFGISASGNKCGTASSSLSCAALP